MKRTSILCITVLAALLAPVAFAAKQTRDPHAVTPRSLDWLCAQNTSQLAQGLLKNAGLIDPAKVDDQKTEVRLLLKKSFGGGRYEQVYQMVLHQNDGKSIGVITESTTESDGECPGSAVKVFVVSHELGDWPSLEWVFPPK